MLVSWNDVPCQVRFLCKPTGRLTLHLIRHDLWRCHIIQVLDSRHVHISLCSISVPSSNFHSRHVHITLCSVSVPSSSLNSRHLHISLCSVSVPPSSFHSRCLHGDDDQQREKRRRQRAFSSSVFFPFFYFPLNIGRAAHFSLYQCSVEARPREGARYSHALGARSTRPL